MGVYNKPESYITNPSQNAINVMVQESCQVNVMISQNEAKVKTYIAQKSLKIIKNQAEFRLKSNKVIIRHKLQYQRSPNLLLR